MWQQQQQLGTVLLEVLARNLSLNVILKVRIDGPKECHNKAKLLTMFESSNNNNTKNIQITVAKMHAKIENDFCLNTLEEVVGWLVTVCNSQHHA